MKKLMSILLICTFLMVGCGVDDITYFHEARKTTYELKSGKHDWSIDWQMKLNDEISQQLGPWLSSVESLKFNSKARFEDNNVIARQYIGSQLLGLDGDYYRQKDQIYFKVPFLGKYLDVDALRFENMNLSNFNGVSEETGLKIAALWLALATEDDVVNLGPEVLDTVEGEVKVKKFVVTLSHQQIHDFVLDVMAVLMADEGFQDQIINWPLYEYVDGEFVPLDEQLTLESFETYMQLILDGIIVDEFKMIAYIDVDQYIIETHYDMSFSMTGFLANIVETIQVKSDYELYDLHESQQLVFPEITEENETTLNEVIEKLQSFMN